MDRHQIRSWVAERVRGVGLVVLLGLAVLTVGYLVMSLAAAVAG